MYLVVQARLLFLKGIDSLLRSMDSVLSVIKLYGLFSTILSKQSKHLHGCISKVITVRMYVVFAVKANH